MANNKNISDLQNQEPQLDEHGHPLLDAEGNQILVVAQAPAVRNAHDPYIGEIPLAPMNNQGHRFQLH